MVISNKQGDYAMIVGSWQGFVKKGTHEMAKRSSAGSGNELKDDQKDRKNSPTSSSSSSASVKNGNGNGNGNGHGNKKGNPGAFHFAFYDLLTGEGYRCRIPDSGGTGAFTVPGTVALSNS